MQKFRFALDIEDDWPPVATESVWCEEVAGTYQLKNAPFFIKGLAFGDKFTAEPDPVNGCVFEFALTESSGHSLAWILKNDGEDFGPERDHLLKLGCSVEGFPAFNLWSVDIPETVDASSVDKQLNRIEELGFAVAVPVWRHDT
jgi:hypothetical protein